MNPPRVKIFVNVSVPVYVSTEFDLLQLTEPLSLNAHLPDTDPDVNQRLAPEYETMEMIAEVLVRRLMTGRCLELQQRYSIPDQIKLKKDQPDIRADMADFSVEITRPSLDA